MKTASTTRHLTRHDIFLLVLLLFGPGIPIQAATFEFGVGGWQQIPKGSVSYTYNVADIAINTTQGVVHDLFPLTDNLLDQLSGRMNKVIGDVIPGADPDGVLEKIFTRTDTLDFQDDCRYDPVIRPTGRLKIQVSPYLNFYIMATPIVFDGPGQADLDFNFMGVTFISGQPFESKLRLTHFDVAYFIDLPYQSMGKNWELHTDVGLNARIVDFYAAISQDATDLSASADYVVPLPMLYLSAQLKNENTFSIEAEARGLRYSGDYTYSLIGRMRMHISGPLHLAAGYRHDYIKLDVHDIDSEGTFYGPFMETVLIF